MPRVIGWGDEGEDVKAAQKRLNEKGYGEDNAVHDPESGEIQEDGIYGEETHGAVQDFQEDEGIEEDGIGPETSNALYAADDQAQNGDVPADDDTMSAEAQQASMGQNPETEGFEDTTVDTSRDNSPTHDDILGSAGFISSDYESKEYLYHKINNRNKILQDIHSGFEFGYVFITEPELNLFEDRNTLSKTLDYEDGEIDENVARGILTDSEDLRILVQNNAELARYLDSTVPSLPDRDPKFVIPLMNLLSEMSSTDVEFSVKQSPANRRGISIDYPTNYMESLSGVPLELTFTTDRHDTVLKMIHIWTMYMTMIQKGYIRPRAEAILENKFESSCAIYHFVTAEDGETIKFWSKAIGCYPQNIPYSAKSFQRKRDISEDQISVSFYAPFFIAMRPSILMEFNALVGFEQREIPTWRGLPIHARKLDYYFTDSAAIVREGGEYKLRFYNQDWINSGEGGD